MSSKNIKILLSAYSCNPKRGSEDGVGWAWLMEIANRGHEVHVFTPKWPNKEIHGEYFSNNKKPSNLTFHYHDVFPEKFGIKLRKRFGRIYYLLWQRSVVKFAKLQHKEIKFDAVHHITWGSMRFASYLWKLDIPFFIGPVGGAEKAPWHVRSIYSASGWLFDFARDISLYISTISPAVRAMCRNTEVAFSRTPETAEALKKLGVKRVLLGHEISMPPSTGTEKTSTCKIDGPLRILFVGRLVCLKGMDLGLDAFSKLLKTAPDATLTIIGDGPHRKKLEAKAKKLKCHDKIQWKGWMQKEDVLPLYKGHNAFLFPSLHDSGGTAVLEALSYGLPVICLKLGGPALVANKSCGIIVDVNDKKIDKITSDIAQALGKLDKDNELHEKLSKSAIERANELTISKVVDNVYKEITASLIK